MTDLSDLEYLKLNKWRRFLYNFTNFFRRLPGKVGKKCSKIPAFFKKIGIRIADEAKDIVTTFQKGDWKTRISYLIMGFGNVTRGQVARGIFFFLFEALFIFFMAMWGGHYIAQLGSLGEVASIIGEEWSDLLGDYVQTTIYVDNSFKILLYGVLSLFFCVAFVYTWRVNIRQNKLAQEILASGKKLKSGKDDMHSLVDDQFHKTLLALPVTGILVFTVLPIVFMILIAFTNYDMNHTPPENLFTWVGLENFNSLLSWSSNGVNFAATFGEILAWTLMWAFFATFSNYFLGMLVAMMINKKGIHVKKLWRTILVMTIAIPQFISLLYVSKMFANDGIVNIKLQEWGWISSPLPFFIDKNWARVTVIIINIWIGIPYLMLITTGVLMNIPADLYESARIDGANAWQQYTKITLPYMLFVTGPYLLTSFIGNMNNFNVIYLLTGGAPNDISLTGGAGYTDLLVTWLFKLTVNDSNYRMAAVIGIMIFVVVALISLIVYNLMPSTKNEEDFQ